MKIGLLTVHVGSNFGSVLQTVATAKILGEMGNEVEVINYIPPRMTIHGFIKKRKGILGKLKAIMGLPIMGINKQIYGGFLKKNISLTKPLYKKESIAEQCRYDAYIVGSDQVWNSIHNDGVDLTYYLDFDAPGKHIAFSSSFGRDTLPQKEFSIVTNLIKTFSHISTREDSGVKILNDMGIDTAIQTIDPTFLLSKEEWLYYATKRLIEEPYLLIYTPYNISDDSIIHKAAKTIAREKKLKIVTFGWDFRKDAQADKTMLFASPADFLSLMHHAEYVITNSFHGTAFSIILNKQFVVFPPSHFAIRIQSILEFMGLAGRFTQTHNNVKALLECPIDYTSVNKKISSAKRQALTYLKEALMN